MDFLMCSNIFHGFGFRMAKPDEFRPITIPSHNGCLAAVAWVRASFKQALNAQRLYNQISSSYII